MPFPHYQYVRREKHMNMNLKNFLFLLITCICLIIFRDVTSTLFTTTLTRCLFLAGISLFCYVGIKSLNTTP